MNKLKHLWQGLTKLVIGIVLLLVGVVLAGAAVDAMAEGALMRDLARLSNHDYRGEIRQLQSEGRLSEAYELAMFVTAHPDMPGQEDTAVLRDELNKELHSLWGRAKRLTKGFVVGSGISIEEVSGGIASDMILYGDVRDLVKQGYFAITKQDTDTVIVALAGIGVLTELVDVADWAPAVLKGLRKVGAMSRRMGDWIITACKRSVKLRRMDKSLGGLFTSLKALTDHIGLARTASVMKHADTPADVAAITKTVLRSPDAACVVLHAGGKESFDVLKSVQVSEETLVAAAKKGPAALGAFKRGGRFRQYVLMARYGERLAKNVYLGRIQMFLTDMARRFALVRYGLWSGAALTGICAVTYFWNAFLKFKLVFSRFS